MVLIIRRPIATPVNDTIEVTVEEVSDSPSCFYYENMAEQAMTMRHKGVLLSDIINITDDKVGALIIANAYNRPALSVEIFGQEYIQESINEYKNRVFKSCITKNLRK